MRQSPAVDPVQVGGWVAAFGNGVVNARARTAIYATEVDAGIAGLRLAGGGPRVLTPSARGAGALTLTWTNNRAFDALTLRVYRTDGTFVGSVPLAAVKRGPATFAWNGRLGGSRLPAGAYVLQLQGRSDGGTFSAPSAAPVTSAQVGRYGVWVGAAPATDVVAVAGPASPTMAGVLAWRLTFAGPIGGLEAADIRLRGTATGCRIAPPVGSAATWTVIVTGCSRGSVGLTLLSNAVADPVRNAGPAVARPLGGVLIDRSRPTAGVPRATFPPGSSVWPGTAATLQTVALSLAGSDLGGAGIASFDVAWSVDGGPFRMLAQRVTGSAFRPALAPGHRYRFEVRARDRAGNVGAWTVGPTIKASVVQPDGSAFSWQGPWSTSISPDRFSGGSTRWTTAAGASVRYGFSGRAVAWVTTFGPDRGAVRVYLDGAYVTTIDTRAGGMHYRVVAFSRTWSSSGWHTIRLVAVGSPGHPRAEVDALEVLR